MKKNIWIAIPAFLILVNSVCASGHEVYSHDLAIKRVERLLHTKNYEGAGYEEMAANEKYFEFVLISRNVSPGDPAILDYIGVSRRSGRVVIEAGGDCYAYPEKSGDKPLDPRRNKDLPPTCASDGGT